MISKRLQLTLNEHCKAKETKLKHLIKHRTLYTPQSMMNWQDNVPLKDWRWEQVAEFMSCMAEIFSRINEYTVMSLSKEA